MQVKTQIQTDLLDAVTKKYGQSDQQGTTKAIDLLQEKVSTILYQTCTYRHTTENTTNTQTHLFSFPGKVLWYP